MEDSEANDLSVETLGAQFETLKQRTSKSPVQMFGEPDIENDLVGEYIGVNQGKLKASKGDKTLVDSRDAKLAFFMDQAAQNDADEGMF